MPLNQSNLLNTNPPAHFNGRRYYSYADYFKSLFGSRIQKLAVNAGFTCPNRDGKVAFGGCAYCNNEAFNPSYCLPQKSVRQQLEEGIEFHQVRYRTASRYLAYFQAFSNTYAPIEHLKKLYEEALSVPNVIGLVIATRPDCVDDEKLEYLQSLSKQHYICVEYGLESCNDATLAMINRGHTAQQTIDAIRKTAVLGINVGTHLIFGLPNETPLEMLRQVQIINDLPIKTLKIHQLQIARKTAFAERYLKNPNDFRLFELNEYLHLIRRFLEYLRDDIILERFISEMPPRHLLSPAWGKLRTVELWRLLEENLKENDSFQSKLFSLSGEITN